MPIRLKDIARDLGVSAVTVSKVLRNHSDIGEATRRRVLKRIQELNYRPNLAARALITGKSDTIGLVVPDLIHPFFSQVAKAAAVVFRQKGYALLIASSEEEPELEREEIARLLARQVDALVVASAQSTPNTFHQLEEQRTPYVLIDRSIADLTANLVAVDDHKVGVLATEHLVEQGCRIIAHIRGTEVSTAAGRMGGYVDTLQRHGRGVLPQHVVSTGDSSDGRGDVGGYAAAERLLRTDPVPDGIFCYNDPIALGAMRAILHAGLRIPEDIAVVGCGNVLYSDFLRVPLTSVDQGCRMIGEQAAALAMSLIDAQEPVPPKSILVEPSLVVRASTMRG